MDAASCWRTRGANTPIVLSEFGGIAFSADPRHWGYSRSETPQAFADRFAALMKVIRSLELLAGYCYTQFAGHLPGGERTVA